MSGRLTDDFFGGLRNDKGQYLYLSGGQWKGSRSGETIPVDSPIDGSIIGEVQSITREEVDEVVAAARRAQKDWEKTPVNERARLLKRAAGIMLEQKEVLAGQLVKEIAKGKKASMDEVVRTVDLIEHIAEEIKRLQGEVLFSDAYPGQKRDKLSLVERVPVGVVLAISPFNYPINLSASKLAPALAAGNAVIFKAPSSAAIVSLHLAEIFNRAGFPPGTINVVTGKGAVIGDYLTSHEGIDLVNFTGSTATGKRIAGVAGMKALVMELGGKDAAIVMEDADLDLAAGNIVGGAFSYSGQRCTAVKRVLVPENIADELVEKITVKVKALKVGGPEADADVIPLIDEKSAEYVEELINEAVSKGATLVLSGKREKNLVQPTIVDNVTEDMRLAWEEPFGPVLPIIRVSNVDEAIRIANKSEYGLQAAVFTKNIDNAFRVARQLEVGTVQINGKTTRGPDHFPFVGTKGSGLGTQGVKYSIEAMTRTKSVVINLGS